MSKHRFYFHLLEMTIVQMLKAQGFDKAANNRIIEIFTDIAIRYIDLLVKTIVKYMELRGDYHPNIKDLSRTFLELGVFTPNKKLDKNSKNPITLKGIDNFEKWFNSEINERMREVGRPNREFLEERKKSKINALNVNSKMDSLTKALDEQSKQAQLLNPTMPYLPSPSQINKLTPTAQPFLQFSSLSGNNNNNLNNNNNNSNDDNLEEDDYEIPQSAIEEDWIQYLIRDQIQSYLLTQKHNIRQTNSNGGVAVTSSNSNLTSTSNNKNAETNNVKPTLFKGTVLENYIPHDLQKVVHDDRKNDINNNNNFIIAGPISEKLLHTFPYYKSDDENDSDSDSDNDYNMNDINENNNNGTNNDINMGNNNDNNYNNNTNSGLAAYDYYEHHKLYDDEMEDLDLYGQGDDATSNDLNLFG
ncbi:Taf3 protein [Pichia kluyveri]|uniref:Taf3 protein n=1 Tax=Pichia kluyveri TaxID=36015 RepID=A0AAV5QYY3_PICKL|nr:Taf3 protein [Pichia kluyveri]